MSDIWELKYGVFGLLAPLDDTDGDTFSNLAESIHGTDPLDSASRLDFSFTVGVGTYNFNWLGVAEKRYWVESQNMPNAPLWYSLGGAQTAGADGIMSYVTDGSTMVTVPRRMRREIF
ncbi:MAG: thrombospondin type 3 repeat-containing protein, partial [Verrucomicrobiota bacterium]